MRRFVFADKNFIRNFSLTVALVAGYSMQWSLAGVLSKLIRTVKQLKFLCTQYQVNADSVVRQVQESESLVIQVNLLLIVFSILFVTANGVSRKFRILILAVNLFFTTVGILLSRMA